MKQKLFIEKCGVEGRQKIPSRGSRASSFIRLHFILKLPLTVFELSPTFLVYKSCHNPAISQILCLISQNIFNHNNARVEHSFDDDECRRKHPQPDTGRMEVYLFLLCIIYACNGRL